MLKALFWTHVSSPHHPVPLTWVSAGFSHGPSSLVEEGIQLKSPDEGPATQVGQALGCAVGISPLALGAPPHPHG